MKLRNFDVESAAGQLLVNTITNRLAACVVGGKSEPADDRQIQVVINSQSFQLIDKTLLNQFQNLLS